MFLCKSVEIVGEDGADAAVQLPVTIPLAVFRFPVHLQQQAFLQRPGSDTGGVEVLQYLQDLLQFADGSVYAMVDSQLVADAAEVLPQESVIVQTADKIFQDVPLPAGKFSLAHLFVELVDEGSRVSVDNLLVVGVVPLLAGVVGGNIIIRLHALQRRVECVLPFFPFLLCVEVVVLRLLCCVAGINIVCLLTASFQCGIVVQFGIDTLLQFRQRHFQQLHLQHLLLREPLHLLLFLGLDLYLFLCHCFT